jgi:SAM-dependent methyltransferase
MNNLGGIIKRIKQKKELAGIEDSLINDVLVRYLKKTNLQITEIKPSQFKILIKDIRAELRRYAGRFQVYGKEWKARYSLLESNNIIQLLKTHTSTRERMEFYPELKKIIARLKANSILDLGCGINPLALASKEITYYASDINKEELELVKRFFEKNQVEGRTFLCDLRKIEDCPLPNADLCLIFKVLDILDDKGHKVAEKIISIVKSKHILISFSTKTLSGKSMHYPRRFWLERLLKKLGYAFEIIHSKNEVFYLITKSA